ncbi:autotransporter domain-containing protein [Roseimicrobium sp. ORNL1]|uniref:autotransporter domain-containing protein n=1 Tax=Roseimicrobium sp. ORNL1 TaxID=2711231 RepID=UPI00197DA2BD|nr:autotransporter domain-containing protein [Roseimicrobium sp. ORNL1]
MVGPSAVWANTKASGFPSGFDIGSSTGGTATLNILLGGTVTNASHALIARSTGSTATVTVDGPGSTWTNDSLLVVGDATGGSTGTLNIQNGGTVNMAEQVTLGRWAGGTGILNIGAGGAAGVLNVYNVHGGEGTAVLNFNHNNADYYFSANGASTGAAVLISGSTKVYQLGSGKTILTGANTYTGGTTIQNGILQIGAGGAMGSIVGDVFNDASLVFDVSTDIGLDGDITGSGTLTKQGVGTLTLTGDSTLGGVTTINAGALQIGDGGATGSISGNITNDGALVFNNSDVLTYGGIISGTGTFTQDGGTTGTGMLTLTGVNTYNGTTTINGGVLSVNGSINSATTVHSGGTLSGSGSIIGAVTVADGGILAAGNSPGTLTMGELALNNGSQLDFELGVSGVNSDLIDVVADLNGSGSTGNLVLDGVLNVTDAGGFVAGVPYRLMNYDGALVDQGLTLGNLLAGYNITVDTSAAHQVNLFADYTGLQFWDGVGPPLDGVVHGGSGTWNATDYNWTNGDGLGQALWAELTAVFSGSSGTVEVDGTHTIRGLHFSTGGYFLTESNGGGSLSLAAGGAEFRIDEGLVATLAVPLIGDGALTKTGDGEIVLTGVNTYAGGTTVRFGTLTIDGGSISHPDSGVYVGSVSGDNGVLNIRNGGSVLSLNGIIGFQTGSVGTVTVTGVGSTWSDGGDLTVGAWGTGTLNVENGGKVNVNAGAGVLYLGSSAGSSGVLNIGKGASAGVLNAAEVQGVVLDAAVLNFNHTEADYYFTKDGTSTGAPVLITGSTQVHYIGSGQTTLAGVNTYTGATYVNAGTLNVIGSIANTGLHLAGGKFSPGNVGTVQAVTVASLSLTGGGVLMDLADGGVSDHITVTDGLASLTAPTLFTFNNLGTQQFQIHPLIDGLDASHPWDLNLLSAIGAEGRFLLNQDQTQLYYAYFEGGVISGPLIENDFPTATPLNADFLLNGRVRTASLFRSNTVKSLIFNSGSSLKVFNTLTVTDGNFTVNGGRASINGGQILVPGDFHKNGGGTLVTNTVLQIGGSANIHQGALFVNGTFEAGRVNVFRGGLLGGSGVILGDVFNSGTVAPGNSPGTLTIIGNYTQRKSSTLQIEIASEKVFDRLVVSGTARVDGTLDIRNYRGSTLSYGQQVPFLQAGRIVGTFDEILMPEDDLFRGRFINAGHIGILLVAPTSYTLVAETPNQTRVAHALDRWIGIEDGDIGALTLALDLLTAEQYPAAFEAIMPGYYEAALSTGIELSQSQGQMLFQQLSSRRLGMKPPASAPAAPAAPVSAKGTKNVAPVQPQVAITQAPQWNAWMQGSGLFSEGGLSLNPGEDFESGTFMVGADFAVGEHVSLGLFASYQEGWGDYDHGGDTDLESVRFGGYATFDYEGFYASGAVGGGTTDYSVKRAIEWATLDRTARSDPDGTEFFTLLGTGYDFHAGNFTFGPSLSAQYTKLQVDEFTESGADTLDLRVRDAEEESLRTYLGGRIAYTLKVSERLTVIPELRAFWEHEFLQGGERMNAALNGGSGPDFSYVTEEPGKDAMYVGVGLNFLMGEILTTSVYYHANFGRNDDAQHTVSVSVNWMF